MLAVLGIWPQQDVEPPVAVPGGAFFDLGGGDATDNASSRAREEDEIDYDRRELEEADHRSMVTAYMMATAFALSEFL